MNVKSEIPSNENQPSVLIGIFKRVGAMAGFMLLMAVIFFWSAGHLDWIWAWVYLVVTLVSVLIIGAITMFTSPETVAERGEMKIKERWDKIISLIYMLALFFALPLVAGLDERFKWTGDMHHSWHYVGIAVFVIGEFITAWAMIANAFFSTAVRIQDERGQKVCTSGPYQYVRHPGYVGFILQALGMPLLLGSLWALLPAITAALMMIVRTSFEDRMLQAELPGYKDYVHQVSYRLLPGIW